MALSAPACPSLDSLAAAALAHRAGKDGGSLESATRAWRAFSAVVKAKGLPNHGMPASAALVGSFLAHEAASATGSQGVSYVTLASCSGRIRCYVAQRLRRQDGSPGTRVRFPAHPLLQL